MAEAKNQDEPALHATKRTKPDEVEPLDHPKKTIKLDPSDNQTPIAQSLDGKSSAGEAKDAEIEAGPLEDENGEDEDEDYGSDDDEDDEEEEEEGGEKSNNNGGADRKGKGIMRDDKGKGKLILEEEDDDNDDDDDSDNDDSSDDGGSELDSDLSDDPLAGVDLDNILPSRTRRKQFQPPPPGVHIANDLGNNDDDSDESDD